MDSLAILAAALVLLGAAVLWANDRIRQRSGGRTPGFLERPTRHAWTWKGSPPRGVTVTSAVFAGHFFLAWLLGIGLPYYAARTPDATRTSSVRVRGGLTYYVTPVIGCVLNTAWYVDLALLGIGGVAPLVAP